MIIRFQDDKILNFDRVELVALSEGKRDTDDWMINFHMISGRCYSNKNSYTKEQAQKIIDQIQSFYYQGYRAFDFRSDVKVVD